jgi:hypothetical protein
MPIQTIYDKFINAMEDLMGKEHVEDLDINAWMTSERL